MLGGPCAWFRGLGPGGWGQTLVASERYKTNHNNPQPHCLTCPKLGHQIILKKGFGVGKRPHHGILKLLMLLKGIGKTMCTLFYYMG